MLSDLGALLEAGAYAEALREAERLLAEARLRDHEQARAHVAACRSLVALGRPFHAIPHGSAAVACADRAGAKAGKGAKAEARFALGRAAALAGDGALAEVHLSGYLELEPGGSDTPEALTLLGELASRRRRWAEAALLFEKAAAGIPDPASLAQAVLNLAWCHLMLQSPAEAEPWLDRAASAMAEAAGAGPPAAAPRFGPMAAEVRCHRALAARQRGDLDGSDRICREVLGRPGGEAGTRPEGLAGEAGARPEESAGEAGARQLALAAWILGENALDRGDSAEAARLAKLALDHSVRANQPALMNLAGDLRRRMAGV